MWTRRQLGCALVANRDIVRAVAVILDRECVVAVLREAVIVIEADPVNGCYAGHHSVASLGEFVTALVDGLADE